MSVRANVSNDNSNDWDEDFLDLYTDGLIDELLQWSGIDSEFENPTLISTSIEHLDSCIAILDGGKFDFNKFMELAQYLEIGVLYDSFVAVETIPKNNLDKYCSSTRILVNEGLFSVAMGGTVYDATYQREKVVSNLAKQTSIVLPAMDWSSHFQKAFGIEDTHLVPIHVPFEVSNAFLDAFRIERSHQLYSLLLQSYVQLSNSLGKEIQRLQDFTKPTYVFVPPIMTMILKKCSRPDEVIIEFLELRNKFRKLRTKFKEYELSLRDTSVSLENSLKAINNFQRGVNSLTSSLPDNMDLTISEWRDGISLLPDITSLEDVDTNILGLFLRRPLEWIVNRIRNRKLVHLFDIKKEFLKTKNYPSLISNVFGVEVTRKDIQQSFEAANAIERLVAIRASVNQKTANT